MNTSPVESMVKRATSRRILAKPGQRGRFEKLESRLNMSGDWLVSFGGVGQDVARAGIEIDANDNVYVAGDFAGAIQLDPLGSAAGLLTSNGGSRDVFVAKYDSSGGLVWARSFGSNGFEHCWGLALDASANVILTGKFWDTVDFDPLAAHSQNADLLTSTSSWDGYLLKLNSAGQFQWVQQMAGDSEDIVPIVDTDRAGNIYIGTQSTSTQVTFGSLPPIAAGNGEWHAELAKVDAGGSFQWVRAFANGISVQRVKPIVDDRAADPADWSISAVGSYEGQLSLGPFHVVSRGSNDVFFARIDAATGLQTFAAGAIGGPGSDRESSVGIDQAGNVYISGLFEQEVDFDPLVIHPDDRDRRLSQGEADVFVLKLDEALNFVAVNSFGGPGFDAAVANNTLTLSPAGDVLIAGQFEAAIDLGSYSLVSAGETDGFVAALDDGLNVQWAECFGGASDTGSYIQGSQGAMAISWRSSARDDGATGVAFDSQGNLYVVGDFKQTADFPTGNRRTSNGDADIALMRLDLSQPRVSGNIFADFNGNGLRDDRFREGILETAGWGVELVNSAGVVVDTATPLGNSGNFSFNAVAPGTYTVRQALPNGWTETTPGAGHVVTVAAGDDPVRVDFGNTTLTQSRTCVSIDVGKQIRNNRTVTSQLVVPDNVTIFDIDVALDISHTWDSDLDVFLIAPNGTRIELFTHVGGGGDNFAGTILDDDAAPGIAVASAPFTGRFRPEGTLFGLEGISAQGAWTLEITDTFSGNAGQLNSWSLNIFGGTPPTPPPAPVKFYVVDDAASDASYKYAASGAGLGSTGLTAGNSAPRGVASTAAGDKTWVVDANRKVYVYDINGNLLGSWTAGTLASNATPEGIATNGTDVWIVDSKSDKVFKYAGAATRVSGSQNAASSFSLNSGNKDAKDFVTDGASLWVVNGSSTDKVFKYSVAGSLLGSWTISTSGASNPTGITLDPANVSHLWIVDSGTDRVYQYNAAVTRTSGSQSAATSFALAAGNTNPQGIADPPAAAGAVVNRNDLHNSRVATADMATGALQASSASGNSEARRRAAPIVAEPQTATTTPIRDQAFARLGQRPRFSPAARPTLGDNPRGAENPSSPATLDAALAASL